MLTEKEKQQKNKYRAKLKVVVLTHYSNGKLACVSCGENRVDCLSLDHIDDNGEQHRRELGGDRVRGNRWCGWRLYSKLKVLGFPLGYQTLCMNCQWIKAARRRTAKQQKLSKPPSAGGHNERRKKSERS